MGCESGRYACFGFPILELARAHARAGRAIAGAALRLRGWSFVFPALSEFAPGLPSLNHSTNVVFFLFFKLSPDCVPMTVPSVEEILGTLQIIVCPGKVAVQWGKASD